MTQAELNSAIARVTGEPVAVVSELGFQLADPLYPDYDPETRQPLMLDWDSMDVAEWPTR